MKITPNSQNNLQSQQFQFNEVLLALKSAKNRAYQNLNKEIINLYWQIGQYIHQKVEEKLWGKSVVENLANYITEKQPDLKGYSKRNLWRMKQFYECYKDYEKMPTLLAQMSKISWSHNFSIMSRCKIPQEREFYINLSISERLSFRELERQIDTSSFQRVITADVGVSKALKEIVQDRNSNDISAIFKDTYILDFLDDLPQNYKENDLKKSLISGLKRFILEIGKDFSFVGQDFKLEVGNSDFYVDLLFYHRDLQCLVCFELKTTKFKPEHLGQLNFYLGALDQDIKKPMKIQQLVFYFAMKKIMR